MLRFGHPDARKKGRSLEWYLAKTGVTILYATNPSSLIIEFWIIKPIRSALSETVESLVQVLHEKVIKKRCEKIQNGGRSREIPNQPIA